MANPKISVVMPVLNNEAYLRQAIDSVLSQTFSDFEFIILSEFESRRESRSIIESYHDSRIRHIENKSHLGMTRSLNLGLELAKGEYVARMDADDICRSDRFERQVAYLESHPEVGVLGTGYERATDDGTLLRTGRPPMGPMYLRWRLLFSPPLGHPSVMARRDILVQLGGYDPSVLFCEDYDLWIRASNVTRLENLPDSLLTYRIHQGSVSMAHEEIQTNNALALSRPLIAALLSEEVSIDDARSVRMEEGSIENSAAAIRASDLLTRLHSAFLAKNAVTKEEARLIRSDVAARLYEIGFGCSRMDLAAGAPILWKAFRLSRFSLAGFAKSALHQLVRPITLGETVLRARA